MQDFNFTVLNFVDAHLTGHCGVNCYPDKDTLEDFFTEQGVDLPGAKADEVMGLYKKLNYDVGSLISRMINILQGTEYDLWGAPVKQESSDVTKKLPTRYRWHNQWFGPPLLVLQVGEVINHPLYSDEVDALINTEHVVFRDAEVSDLSLGE